MNRAVGCGLVLLAAGATGAYALGGAATAMQAVSASYFAAAGAAPMHSAAQGYLGIDVRDVGDDELTALKMKESRGAEIVLVDHDAPAGKVGLRERDVVLQMNGQTIDGQDQIRRMLRECAPGKTVVLLILRDGQQMTFTMQMANRETLERQAWERHIVVPEPQYPAATSEDGAAAGSLASATQAPSVPMTHGSSGFLGSGLLMNSSYTGAMLEMLSTQLADFFGVAAGHGLLVRSVVLNSPAALAGMHAGDVIVRVNARPVASTSDWAKVIKTSHGRPVAVVVLREKRESTLILIPDGKKRSSLNLPGDRDGSSPPLVAGLGAI